MKTPSDKKRALFPAAIRAVLLASVLTAPGCSFLFNEDEGDPEPRQAEYRVRISPSELTFVFDATSVPPDQELIYPEPRFYVVNLSVQCVGEDLPEGCEQHRPGWSSNWSIVSIANPASPSTTAVITPGPISRFQKTTWHTAVIKPSSVPKKLSLTGNRAVHFQYQVRSSTPERDEDSPKRPKLNLLVHPGLINCYYAGPPAFIIDIKVTGRDASQFTVIMPGLLPLAIGNKERHRIEYELLATEPGEYRADMTILTDTGAFAHGRMWGNISDSD